MLLSDVQKTVEIDGVKMIQEKHSVLVSNWIQYYDYKGCFVRGRHARIYESYDNTLSDTLCTDYDDKDRKYTGSDFHQVTQAIPPER